MYNNLPENALSKKKKIKILYNFFQKVDNCVGCSNTKAFFVPIISCSFIIIQKVTSLCRPLLKYRIDFAWKCNFNIRSIKLQVLSHFLNMLIKSKRWPTEWGAVI